MSIIPTYKAEKLSIHPSVCIFHVTSITQSRLHASTLDLVYVIRSTVLKLHGVCVYKLLRAVVNPPECLISHFVIILVALNFKISVDLLGNGQ